MATNTVTGVLTCSDGTNIPLKGELEEGSESSLQTDSVYTITSVDVGNFAIGKTIVSGLVTSDNGISYCYLLRQGVVQSLIPVGIKGVTAFTPALCAPVTLQAGDVLKCMNSTAASRLASLCVYTTSGVSRIFTATGSGAATVELTDLQTGNSVGSTLQSQRIQKAFFTCVDGSKIETQGAFVVDALGNVVGSVSTTNPANYQALFSSCSIPVDLNFKAQYLLNA